MSPLTQFLAKLLGLLFLIFALAMALNKRTILAALDSGAKRNGLSEADFHVFAKLGENGLERGLEAETFSRGQVCGEDDFLNVLVRELIDIELAGQPAAQSAVGVFDAAFLPRGVGVTKPCRHVAHGA